MRQEYHKLVRDYIPEIIRESGNQCEIKILNELEYIQALRNKLVEEAQEVAKAIPEELSQELADIYEVIDALLVAYNIQKETVIAKQQQRRQTRGGFSKRIELLWTKSPDKVHGEQ